MPLRTTFRNCLSLVIVLVISGCGENFSDTSFTSKALPAPLKNCGPRVVFDIERRVPITPFPDDMMTRPSGNSPTRVKLNLPLNTSTQFEKTIREHLNRLDGFSAFSPISLVLSHAIDVEKFYMLMNDGVIYNDPVIVIKISPRDHNFGIPVPLDVAIDETRSLYPTDRPHREFFPYDPLKDWDNLLFPPGNTAVIEGNVHFINFFDFSSGYLRLRPVLPLDEGSRYVVIITKNLTDKEGLYVCPPKNFSYAHNIAYTEDVRTALQFLEPIGISESDVVFAWRFTTGNAVDELVELRKGLYGSGPHSYLAEEFPSGGAVEMHPVDPPHDDDNPYTLSATFLSDMVMNVISSLGNINLDMDASILDLLLMDSVDYFAFGDYTSPNLIGTESGTFTKKPYGSYEYSTTHVSFMIAVPKPSPANGYMKKPYDVIIFGHGNGGSRLHAIAYANIFARYGFATIAIDAAGHGPDIPLAYLAGPPDVLINTAKKELGIDPQTLQLLLVILAQALGYDVPQELISFDRFGDFMHYITSKGLLKELTTIGRSVDVNGDGVRDSGETFFTADLFRTRDIMRQTILDEMNLVRILKEKGMDTDGDGEIDVGGPGRKVFYTGQSMGGILGSLFAGVEKDVNRFVLNVPGGGLIDILVRTSLTSVAQRIFNEIFGVTFAGGPVEYQGQISYPVTLNNTERTPPGVLEKMLGELEVHPGEVVIGENLSNGEKTSTVVDSEGHFVLHLQADPGDRILIYVEGDPARHLYLVLDKRTKGLGIKRNTYDFLRFIDIAFTGIAKADPVLYASHYNNDLITWQTPWGVFQKQNQVIEGYKERSVLIQVALGDTTVPMSTGFALARSAGALSYERMKKLTDLGITWGLLTNYAPVNFDFMPGNPPDDPSQNAWLRLHMGGKYVGRHEYYAYPVYEEDSGTDLRFNESEEGFSKENLDPAGDDYCTNPEMGTERNGILDQGEDRNGNGILEVNYTFLAQNQSAYFFRYGKLLDGIDDTQGGVSTEEVRTLINGHYCPLVK